MSNIAVIGNLVFDCNVSTDKPLKEDTRNNFSDVVFSAGGPATNAACVIGKFGGNVDFYGKVGNDVFGKIVKKELKKESINIKHLCISKRTMTPFGFIIVNKDNKTRTICSLRSLEDFKKPSIDTIRYSKKYDYILTDGKYTKESLKLIKENPKATTIIDAGRVNDEILELCKHIDYIICSEEFANEVTGKIINDDYINNCIIYNDLEKKFPNAKGITITIGSKGYICKKDNEVINFSAHKLDKEVIDTNGAGDIFHGAFTYALSTFNDYYKSLEFANVTAALSTTKRGGRKSIPELEEVKNAIKKQETGKVLVKKL